MWAYEAIPALGDRCTNLVAPHAIPRCLRRKFKMPSDVDFDALFTQQVMTTINFLFVICPFFIDFFHLTMVAEVCCCIDPVRWGETLCVLEKHIVRRSIWRAVHTRREPHCSGAKDGWRIAYTSSFPISASDWPRTALSRAAPARAVPSSERFKKATAKAIRVPF